MDEASEIIDTGTIAFVGVDTRRGPHVTPQVYAHGGGRFWTSAAKNALKVRTIRNRPAVVLTIFARDGRRAAVIHGDAHVVDYADPIELLRTPVSSLLGVHGARRLVTQNPAEITSSFADLARGRLALDDRRVLVDIHPDRVEVIDAAGDAVLAVRAASGLVARPVSWDAQKAMAHLSSEATLPSEDAPVPACVSVDLSEGVGAGSKRGELFRGQAAIRDGVIAFDVERVTRWSGDDVQTERVA